LTKWPQKSKWRQEPVFSNNFQPISEILNAFEVSFYSVTFVEYFIFRKSKMSDFSMITTFFRKNLYKRVSSTINSIFFSVQRPKIYQKKLPNKIFEDGGYFQNGVCTFFYRANFIFLKTFIGMRFSEVIQYGVVFPNIANYT
jgi:hypothetical protein